MKYQIFTTKNDDGRWFAEATFDEDETWCYSSLFNTEDEAIKDLMKVIKKTVQDEKKAGLK